MFSSTDLFLNAYIKIYSKSQFYHKFGVNYNKVQKVSMINIQLSYFVARNHKCSQLSYFVARNHKYSQLSYFVARNYKYSQLSYFVARNHKYSQLKYLQLEITNISQLKYFAARNHKYFQPLYFVARNHKYSVCCSLNQNMRFAISATKCLEYFKLKRN